MVLNNSIGPKRYMSLVAGFPRPARLIDGRCSVSEVTSESKLAIGNGVAQLTACAW